MTGNIPAESPWERARLGKFTSSRIDDLLTEPKSKAAKEAGELSESAKTYIRSRAAEIITGCTRQTTNWAMEWGNTYEPMAAELLSKEYPSMVYLGKQDPRFFPYTDFSGGSPDGIDTPFRIVFEIKCPEDPENYVTYCLLKSDADLKKAERGYYHQIQFNMLSVAKHLGVDFSEMVAVFAAYCPIVNDPYPKMKTLIIHPDMEFYERIGPVLEKSELMLAEIVFELKAGKVMDLVEA